MRPATPKPSSTATSTPSSAPTRKPPSVSKRHTLCVGAGKSVHPEESKAKRFSGITLALVLTLLTLLPSSSFLLPLPAHAQSGPTVTDGGADFSFPDRLVFRAPAGSSAASGEGRPR